MRKKLHQTFLMLVAFMMSISLSAQGTSLLDENFDDLADYAIPTAWDRSATISDENDNWRAFLNHNLDSKCLFYVTDYAIAGDVGVVKTSAINVGVQKVILSFDYKKISGEDFAVYISTDGGLTYEDNLIFSTGHEGNQEEWGSQYIHKEFPLFEYGGDNVKIVFVAKPDMNSFGRDASIFLDNVKIIPSTSCAQPIDLFINGLSQTQVKLNWDSDPLSAYTSKNYNLLLKNSSTKEEVFNGRITTIDGDIYTITGLQANTTYTANLQSDCEYQDDSEWSSEISFTTLCDAIAIPIDYDFSTETADIPVCWVAQGEAILSSYQATGGAEDKSIKLSSSAFIATPPLNHTADDMEVSFKVYGAKNAKFQVLLTNDVKSLEAGVPISEELTISDANTWTDFVLNTADLSDKTAGYSLMFYASEGNANAVYIDDVSIQIKPTCVRPDFVIVSNVTNTYATFTWEGEQVGSDFEVKINDEVVPVSSNTYTHTTLTSATPYTVALRQKCSATETSEWSVENNFTTLCAPATSISLEGFEGDIFPPACWASKQTILGTSEGADYGDEAWTTSSNEVKSGSKSAMLQKSKSGTHSLLALPYITTTSGNSHELRFYMYRTNGAEELEGVKVFVNSIESTDGGTELAYIRHNRTIAPTEDIEGWYQYTVPITMAGNVVVMFEGISENGSDIYIDDVEVRERPSCLPILRIKHEGVDATKTSFSWTTQENAAASQWIVSYKTPEMPKAIEATVNQTSYTIPNLTSNTDYSLTFKIRSLCDVGNESEELSIAVQFKTPCEYEAFPYTEDFEEGFAIDCWAFPVKDDYETGLVDDQTKEIKTKKLNVVVSRGIRLDTWVGKRISVHVRGLVEKVCA